jgi:hypothetical protein
MVSDLILKHRNKLTKMLYMSKTSVFTDMFTIREIFSTYITYAFNRNFN